MSRLFVAIELDDAVRTKLTETLDALKQIITRQGVRFVSPAKLHVTLRFLGHVPEELLPTLVEELGKATQECSTLDVAVGKMGCFPDPARPKVIWQGVHSEALEALAQRVTEATALAPEADDKPFAPHITLARVSPGSKQVGWLLRPMLELEAPELSWTVKEAALMQTQADGSYLALHRFPLGPA